MNLIQADETDRVVERKEIPLFDNKAFREAVINAVLHNKWVEGNEPMISVFSDRIKLIQSLEEESEKGNRQTIITTHSPLLASVVKLSNIVIVKSGKAYSLAKEQTKLDEDDYLYLEKYLDATKANLFFARSVIIVEGPGEALLLPTLSKLLGCNFTDYGTSLVDVRSTGLRRYARIFQRKDENKQLDVNVACVTDRDIQYICSCYESA